MICQNSLSMSRQTDHPQLLWLRRKHADSLLLLQQIVCSYTSEISYCLVAVDVTVVPCIRSSLSTFCVFPSAETVICITDTILLSRFIVISIERSFTFFSTTVEPGAPFLEKLGNEEQAYWIGLRRFSQAGRHS
jgi:hypothetical protein